MNAAGDADLPPFAVIAAALRKTTERLTREIASPQAEPPDWNEFEWRVARAVCAMHGISALLATRLLWRGPPDWLAFLREQHTQTLACSERIGEVLARLDDAARRAGVSCVALKGSAVRALSLHLPGERPMGDIDLLIRPDDVAAAARVIESLDYEAAFSSRRHRVFMPRHSRPTQSYGEHVDNPLRIEVHERVFEPLPVQVVDITSSLWPSRCRPGLNPYATFPALMRHILLHTSGNMRANAMRFLQLYEIAVFARRMDDGDWSELLGGNPRTGWWVYPALSMAERYAPGSVPRHVLDAFAEVCPRRLRAYHDARCVYDLSWSNLRITAMPGVAWSRSWADAWRFARNRFFPTRQARKEVAQALATLPNLANTEWYGVSRARRALRWLVSRPPRAQTISSVRAALSAGRDAQH